MKSSRAPGTQPPAQSPPPGIAIDDLLLGEILEPLVEYEGMGFELGDRREGPARTARSLVRHRGHAVVFSPVVRGHERGARRRHERHLVLAPSLGQGQETEELLLFLGRKPRDGRFAGRPLVTELGVPFVDLGDSLVLALLREDGGRRRNERGENRERRRESGELVGSHVFVTPLRIRLRYRSLCKRYR